MTTAVAATMAVVSVWDARVLRFGRSANGRHWGSRVADDLVELLPLVPVRCVRRDGRLIHPPAGRVVPPVGVVVRAWADAHGVHAILAIFDDTAHRALAALERDRQLAKMAGLSLAAQVLYRPHRDPDGVMAQVITGVQEVEALDLVTWPSSEGCVLRSRKEVAASQ